MLESGVFDNAVIPPLSWVESFCAQMNRISADGTQYTRHLEVRSKLNPAPTEAKDEIFYFLTYLKSLVFYLLCPCHLLEKWLNNLTLLSP
jgi:hypothetical protein